MTLTEFLLARIAEDEAEAQRLIDDYPSFNNDMRWFGDADNVAVRVGLGRVLAECEAKRQLIDLCDDIDGPLSLGHWEGHGSEERWIQDHEYEILRILATPYADHPDFRVEWALS